MSAIQKKEVVWQKIIKCKQNLNSGIGIGKLNEKTKRYCKNCPIKIKEACHAKGGQELEKHI